MKKELGSFWKNALLAKVWNRSTKSRLRRARSRVSELFTSGVRNRQAFNIVLVAAVTFNTLSIGLPALIGQYAEQQARIPHALASSTAVTAAPAADTVPVTGKAAPVSSPMADQLANELNLSKNGKPSNKTHVQALDEGRTTTDRVWLNADGTKSLERSMSPTSFQDNGQWKDIDTSLAQDATTGKWQSKANTWQARFDKLSSTTGVELAVGSQTLLFTPVGGASVAPVITGTSPHQIVTYRDVWQGIDLVYQLSSSQLKESIVVKSRVAANTFSFDLTGASATPDSEFPGGFKLDGALSGFRLAAPTIATATQGILGSGPMVQQNQQGSRLTVTLDKTWMTVAIQPE